MEVKGQDYNEASDKPKAHSPTHLYYYAVATVFLVMAPSSGLVIWISKNSLSLGHNYGLDSQPLGGHLTLIQAKAIDFICGALIAPLALVAVNWYWFSVTRVTIPSDGSTRAIPLAALVEASHTDTGSYSPMKLMSLVRSGRPKMVFLGILALLSAVAQTCFSNVIAYEAYSINVAQSSPVVLRALMTGLPNTFIMQDPVDYSRSTYNFTMAQSIDFKSQATSMLSNIAFAGSDGELNDDTYVALNVTKGSLDRLPPEITKLEDVPAYRVSIHCNAEAPNIPIRVIMIGQHQVMASISIGTHPKGQSFQARFPGEMEEVDNEDVRFESWLTFNYNYCQSYYLHMVRSNESGKTDTSPYGTITYIAHEVHSYHGTKSVMTAWGFLCDLRRESGVANLSRNRDLSWQQESTSWTGKQETIPWMIADWQLALNYRSPARMGGQPGLGPAIAETAIPNSPDGGYFQGNCTVHPCLDYHTSIMNLLYASGEIERLVYESLNANASLESNATYAVKATARSDVYRITYIPLLLCGLLSSLWAALIPLGLLVHGRRSNSVRNWRRVNTVQLMADTVTGLRDEHIMEQMRTAGPSRSDELARTAKVKYEVVGGKDVSLKLVEDPTVSKDQQSMVSGEDTETEFGP